MADPGQCLGPAGPSPVATVMAINGYELNGDDPRAGLRRAAGIDSSEISCMQAPAEVFEQDMVGLLLLMAADPKGLKLYIARSKISAAFDELNTAAEHRCAELLEHLKENSTAAHTQGVTGGTATLSWEGRVTTDEAGREPMGALIKEKETCSTALVDIWCVIDFMEKARHRLRAWHRRGDLDGQEPPLPWLHRQVQGKAPLPRRGEVDRASHDVDSMLQSLASFGSIQVNPRLGAAVAGTMGQTWADVFEEAEELPGVSLEVEEPATELVGKLEKLWEKP
eukprot:Skav207741  [mRNA]  locus=scaffold362:418386:423561:- [translate_table: standard]